MKIQDLLNIYLFDEYRRKETEISYTKVVRQFNCQFPDIHIEDLTREMIISWRKEALQKIKPVTWNNRVAHLNSLYNYAIKNNLTELKTNPFERTKVTEGVAQFKVLTQKQISKIDTVITNSNLDGLTPSWFIASIIKTLRYTGIRRTSLVNLKLQDIDLEANNINITPENSKTHHHYQIPIAQQLIPHIKNLYSEHLKLGSKKEDQLFNINLFKKSSRKKMTKCQLDYIFKIISKKVDFHVSPHRFRHTLATELMKDPNNIYIAKCILGHRNISVTMRYIKYSPEQLRKYLNKYFK